MTNLELFNDDIYLANLAKENNLQKEVADFQRRIESVMTKEELKDLAGAISGVPLRTLAEYGNKIISILNYNLLK